MWCCCRCLPLPFSLFLILTSNLHITMDGTRRPQFFKKLLPGFKLSIPLEFVKHIVNENHGKATIFSVGKFWHVKVEEDDEGCHFGDGWLDMVESHDLNEGYFMIFRYEGYMVFTLKVFDSNGCRKYDFPTVGKSWKKRKATIRDEENHPVTVLKKENATPITCSTRRIGKPTPNYARATTTLEKQISSSKKKVTQLDGKGHGSNFEKTIRPSNLVYSFIYFGFSSYQQVMLRDEKAKSWPVSLTRRGKSSKFGKGSGDFSKEHKVEEGDTCAFQLVSKEKNIVEVHITKRSAS